MYKPKYDIALKVYPETRVLHIHCVNNEVAKVVRHIAEEMSATFPLRTYSFIVFSIPPIHDMDEFIDALTNRLIGYAITRIQM